MSAFGTESLRVNPSTARTPTATASGFEAPAFFREAARFWLCLVHPDTPLLLFLTSSTATISQQFCTLTFLDLPACFRSFDLFSLYFAHPLFPLLRFGFVAGSDSDLHGTGAIGIGLVMFKERFPRNAWIIPHDIYMNLPFNWMLWGSPILANSLMQMQCRELSRCHGTLLVWFWDLKAFRTSAVTKSRDAVHLSTIKRLNAKAAEQAFGSQVWQIVQPYFTPTCRLIVNDN